jgi:hypothetical protein
MNDIKETWYKWDYVCPDCDANIEMTAKSDGHSHDSYCLKCAGDLVLMSVVDATIRNSTTEKEEPIMETTLTSTYNPSMLVTYKKIAGTYASPEAPEYITEKVSDIEWSLHQGRVTNEKNIEHNNKVNKLENILSSYCQEATDPDMELIGEIANLFDIRLTKDISFSGSISFSGTVTVDLTEDFDLDELIQSNISVDAYNGDIEINDYSVEDVREDY